MSTLDPRRVPHDRPLHGHRRADFVRLDAPSYIHLAYRPGVPLIRDVVKSGRHFP
jgi:hypothetical protein